MPIELHCQHCNKLVRAPDSAAGKKAKCPYCQQEVYVRTPPEEIEPLELAPLDEDWQERQKRLDAEAKSISEALLHEKAIAEGTAAGSSRGGASGGPLPTGAGGGAASPSPAPPRTSAEALVVDYLLAMKDSRLPEAERIRKKLASHAAEAKDFAQQLSVDPMPPPELADVPPGTLRGFLKNLLARL
jgi:phage FluMu protein Com